MKNHDNKKDRLTSQEGNKERINQLMELFAYDIEEHFFTEEELMREGDFFAYPMHKAEHDSMRQEVKALKRTVNTLADASYSKMGLHHRYTSWGLSSCKSSKTSWSSN